MLLCDGDSAQRSTATVVMTSPIAGDDVCMCLGAINFALAISIIVVREDATNATGDVDDGGAVVLVVVRNRASASGVG